MTDGEWERRKEHDEAFGEMKEAIKKMTGLIHLEKSAITDNMRRQQRRPWSNTPTENRRWMEDNTIRFQIFTEFKPKYSNNESELLAVVWSSKTLEIMFMEQSLKWSQITKHQ